MTVSAVAAMTGEGLEDVVAAAAARCLRTSTAVDRDAPLSLLGLDSLAAIELAADLEETLGCALPAELLEESADVRSLAARIRSLQAPTLLRPTDGPFERMLADSRLPADVHPSREQVASVSLETARHILLTGATGFLGAALAREILRRSDAVLFCLVRSNGNGAGGERLRSVLSAAGIHDDVLNTRVRLVSGDLAQARLGMTRGEFDGLAHNIDAIWHAGAAVNWVYSYAGLRGSNVLGTIELLRLACASGSRCTPLHFISSLSVCHSTAGPRAVDEDFDPLPHLRGVHLGYAQTKTIAEALVRQAGERGLPVRIYRPGLISGDSCTGAFNADDLLSTLLRGCVHMGRAPDLDWRLDVLPVDVVAKAIVQLSSASGRVFHLAHDRPRHWREVVLWMRLYGYPIRLVPYHAWLRQLDSETNPSARAVPHPLRPLRSFFLGRPSGEHGLTLPELYEETRRTRVSHGRTSIALTGEALDCPVLDTRLLDTYFTAFIEHGSLPAPPAATKDACPRSRAGDSPRRPVSLHLDPAFFTCVIPQLHICDTRPLAAGSDHSIVSELASWRCRRPTGLFRVRLSVDGPDGRREREVFVKIKARDEDVIAVGEALAALCDPEIAVAYARWKSRVGLSQGHERELAIYAQQDPRFLRHAPRVLRTHADPSNEVWAIVLEQIEDAVLIDAVDRPEDWTRESISAAIEGLAALQSIWFGREAELRAAPWIGYVQSAAGMAQMADLWTALARHAAPAFSSWADPSIAAIHRHLVANVDRWWGTLEQAPQTLIHNDFNPRNICIRGGGDALRLCAYDWELATIGAPQRDLAELLCFVLPPDVACDEVEYWIEKHRSALAFETGVAIDEERWRTGFRAALGDLLVNRFAMYALIHRVRPQGFLPRVVRTWRGLFEHFPVEEGRC